MFDEPPGSYALCDFCDWEDDALQLEFATTLDGGANRESLLEAQKRVLAAGRIPPNRDPAWRPIDLAKDDFPKWQGGEPRAPQKPDALYYWRPTFWRRRG